MDKGVETLERLLDELCYPLPRASSDFCVRDRGVEQIAEVFLWPETSQDQLNEMAEDLFGLGQHRHFSPEVDRWTNISILTNILNLVKYENLPSLIVRAILLKLQTVKAPPILFSTFALAYSRTLSQMNISPDDLREYAHWVMNDYPVGDGISIRKEMALTALASHPELPGDVLEELCYSPERWLRADASKHPNCPEEARIVATLLGMA